MSFRPVHLDMPLPHTFCTLGILCVPYNDLTGIIIMAVSKYIKMKYKLLFYFVQIGKLIHIKTKGMFYFRQR